MERINFENNMTKANAQTFNTLQDNIEKAISYSTDEIQIGKWVDGKPLYRKVYTQNYRYDEDISVDVRRWYIDNDTTKNVINSYGRVKLSEGHSVAIGTGDCGYGSISNVNKNASGELYIAKKPISSYGSVNEICVILEYTKTTD